MDVAALQECSTAERADAIDQLHGLMSATHAQLLTVVADYDRRQDWREDGATSMADWLVARLGLTHRHARESVRVARCLEQLPTLAAAFGDGRLSFDQLAPATLAMLCGHHHRLIHEGGWRIEGHPGDELAFVHAGGQALATRPPPLRPEVRERLLA